MKIGWKAKHGLTLKRDIKRPKWSKGSSIFSLPVFGEEERRKREKELGFAKDQVLDEFASHFLLLRDQATYKKIFKEAKVRKSNPNLIFL